MQTSRRRRDLANTAILNGTNTLAFFAANNAMKRSENTSLLQLPGSNGPVEVFPKNEKPVVDSKALQEEKQSRKKNHYYEYIYKEVNASVLSVVINELRHYSSYTVSVRACREGEGDNCSNEVIAHQRTAKISMHSNSFFVRFRFLIQFFF